MFGLVAGDAGDELDVVEGLVLQQTGHAEVLLRLGEKGQEVRDGVSMSVWEVPAEAEEGEEGGRSSEVRGDWHWLGHRQ